MSYAVPFLRYTGIAGVAMFLYHVDDLAMVLDKHMSDIAYDTSTNTLHLGHPRDVNGVRDQVNAAASKLQALPGSHSYIVVLQQLQQDYVGQDISAGFLDGLALTMQAIKAPGSDPRTSFLLTIPGFANTPWLRLFTGAYRTACQVTCGQTFDGLREPLTQDAAFDQAATALRQFFRALADRLDWILGQSVTAVRAHAGVFTLSSESADEVPAFGGVLSTTLTGAHNQRCGSYVEMVGQSIDRAAAPLLRTYYSTRNAENYSKPNLVVLAAVFHETQMPHPGLEQAAIGVDTIIERLRA